MLPVLMLSPSKPPQKYSAKNVASITLTMLEEGESEAKICRVTGLIRKELQLLKHGLKE